MGGESARKILEIVKGKRLEVRLQVVTHFHIDHSTAAGWIEAPLAMGWRDWRHIVLMVDRWPEPLHAMMELYRASGMPSEEVEMLARKHPAFSRIEFFEKLVDTHRKDIVELRDGDRLDMCGHSVVVVEVPGHTPGHIALMLQDTKLIAGDHVLEDITPNISALSLEGDPLGDYLKSLVKVLKLNPRRILPGHGKPIDKPFKRVRELIEHHKNRLREVYVVLREVGEATAYKIASRVKWDVPFSSWDEFPVSQKYFAVGETLSHLLFLERRGLAGFRELGGTRLYHVKGDLKTLEAIFEEFLANSHHL